MPRYYFDLVNREGSVADAEGAELAGLDAARRQAVAAVLSIVSEETRRGLVDLRGRIRVRDGRGATLFTLPFAEAVDIRTGPPPVDGVEPGIGDD